MNILEKMFPILRKKKQEIPAEVEVSVKVEPTTTITVKVEPAPAPVPAPFSGNLKVRTPADLQRVIGATPDGAFGPISKAKLLERFTNRNAKALTEEDFKRVADDLGVSVAVVKAVRKVEAPRGAFETTGRPTILFEKHIFGKETGYRYNQSHPDLSSGRWMPGTYGASGNQWNRLAAACALNPNAAFRSCSWGAFQVMGNNAEDMGYESAVAMALELTKSEAAHLECFVRYIKMRKLEDELRQCRAGNAESCVPFVSKYNGPGYKKNNYHVNFARAIRTFS